MCITCVQTLLSSNTNYLNTLTGVLWCLSLCHYVFVRYLFVTCVSRVYLLDFECVELFRLHHYRSLKGDLENRSLYDHGFLRNVQYLLGHWSWLWLLPIGSANNGNGFLPEPNEKGKALLCILVLQAKQIAI